MTSSGYKKRALVSILTIDSQMLLLLDSAATVLNMLAMIGIETISIVAKLPSTDIYIYTTTVRLRLKVFHLLSNTNTAKYYLAQSEKSTQQAMLDRMKAELQQMQSLVVDTIFQAK